MSKDFQFDKNWNFHPIGGDTGQAFMGINGEEKIFVKRNSSPLIPALSREGIAPKLVWTKRTSDGATLIAQEWLEGKLLTSHQIGQCIDVIHILRHLHTSSSLLTMMRRIGGIEKEAFDFLSEYVQSLPKAIETNQYLLRVFRYLEDHLPTSNPQKFTVCHGDPVHNNWIVSKSDNKLYLVDWDAATIADPAVDLGIVLGRYIAITEWEKWLLEYGIQPTNEVFEKIYWYALMDILFRIKQNYRRFDYKSMNREILLLKELFTY